MIGRIIDGYEIVDSKGSGSFGSVYVCIKNNCKFAMKIFNSFYVASEFSKGDDNRVTREIQALKIVSHPNVVSYVDEGSFSENNIDFMYVVMDYADGEDLEKYLKKRSFSVEEAMKVFNELLAGISAIHNANIVHRDLKPANIFIKDDMTVKVLDFGLSKLIDFTSITSTGAEIGSPLYMSPEQISDSKNIDYRSDYYALGVILFEIICKQNPYGNVHSRHELYNKIINEPPLSIRQFVPTIPNNIDNLIRHLLEKSNYNRPNNLSEIEEYLQAKTPDFSKSESETFMPTFFLRTWNEKKVVDEFLKDGNKIESYIFPINHQNLQKNLLKIIIDSREDLIIDPATMRLAYDSYTEVKGLMELPYAPTGLNRLELDDLSTLSAKRGYVKSVVDAQLQCNPTYVVSPFHVSNNSNLVKIKSMLEENWFSLDIKLLYETKDYLTSINCSLPLVCGLCVKTDILTAKTERDYFLNVVTALPCDLYWIYVDCIDYSSNPSQLFNYANALLTIQSSTKKPVIAGRVNTFGLILLAFGLYGFESGASRFESFYEDLYKTTGDPYNMYVNYYFPELLKNVPVERKNPAKIISLLSSATGETIKCNCPYCINKRPEELANDALAKKHFLFRRHEEINDIRSISSSKERVSYIEASVNNAIKYYQALKPVFKPDDYSYLKVWHKVIDELKKVWIK